MPVEGLVFRLDERERGEGREREEKRNSYSLFRTRELEQIHCSIVVASDDRGGRGMCTIDVILLHILRPDANDIITNSTRSILSLLSLSFFVEHRSPRPGVPSDLLDLIVTLHFFAQRCFEDQGVVTRRARLQRSEILLFSTALRDSLE